jgi:aminoglycoside/choline kinase family phosphotransferase
VRGANVCRIAVHRPQQSDTVVVLSVIDILVRFSTTGMEGFDPVWTCQSVAYDRTLILERECTYFVEAFLKGYLGLEITVAEFETCFEKLSQGALEGAFYGLMHRDFQSRNLLMHQGRPRIIDFQGARKGPIQYDLASLLIDPYVKLPEPLQEDLFGYTLSRLSETHRFQTNDFRSCYEFCRITRNLQMLGAFAHLTRIKGKQQFEQYIPAAVKTLRRNLSRLDLPELGRLRKTVDNLNL